MTFRHSLNTWPQALSRTAASAWLLALMLGCSGFSAYADDEPFQMENSHWRSFDHYKDADKRGNLPPPPPEPVATSDNGPAPASTDPTAAGKPVVAAPHRPIDLPVMPGMNKGFAVQVNSTEDENAPPPLNPSDVGVVNAPSDKNWQSPVSVQGGTKNEETDEDMPLNVRMTYLPNKNVVPIDSPRHPSAQKLGHEQLDKMLAAKHAPPAATQTAAETAACAAIDAYKKQQLSAIQSDRETLKALQDAIHSLGLDKQLDFMAGGDSSLNVMDHANTPPTTIR